MNVFKVQQRQSGTQYSKQSVIHIPEEEKFGFIENVLHGMGV